MHNCKVAACPKITAPNRLEGYIELASLIAVDKDHVNNVDLTSKGAAMPVFAATISCDLLLDERLIVARRAAHP